jgi:hypothetical protein
MIQSSTSPKPCRSRWTPPCGWQDVQQLAASSAEAAPLAAAQAAQIMVAQRPDAEILALWLADAVLAARLKWPRPLPLIAGALVHPWRGNSIPVLAAHPPTSAGQPAVAHGAAARRRQHGVFVEEGFDHSAGAARPQTRRDRKEPLRAAPERGKEIAGLCGGVAIGEAAAARPVRIGRVRSMSAAPQGDLAALRQWLDAFKEVVLVDFEFEPGQEIRFACAPGSFVPAAGGGCGATSWVRCCRIQPAIHFFF